MGFLGAEYLFRGATLKAGQAIKGAGLKITKFQNSTKDEYRTKC